jgi:hypothetical protein
MVANPVSAQREALARIRDLTVDSPHAAEIWRLSLQIERATALEGAAPATAATDDEVKLIDNVYDALSVAAAYNGANKETCLWMARDLALAMPKVAAPSWQRTPEREEAMRFAATWFTGSPQPEEASYKEQVKALAELQRMLQEGAEEPR